MTVLYVKWIGHKSRLAFPEGTMILAVFGGTGKTGRHVVEQALAAGHSVRMLARSPEKVTKQSPNLVVVQGTLTDATRVVETVRGADAVISALGPTHNKPTFDISTGMQQIVTAMKQEGVTRLVLTAGAGVRQAMDQPGLADKLIVTLLKTFNKNVLLDMEKALQIVQASDLEWTAVRAPMLTDDAAKGSVRMGAVGTDIGTRLSRADFAAELLRQVEDRTWVAKAPAISN
jgi:putative NADH-flavin reductase